MKRLLKRTGAILMAFCMSLSFAMAAYAEETVSGARISGATLQSDGTASWTIEGVPADREVEYYQLRFSRLSNGNWNDSYRTVNVYDETSYSMYFSSTGVYRFRVRARFYGGAYTNWSEYSNEVTVTRDDLSSSGGGLDPGADIIYNNNRYGNYGPGYALGGNSPSGSTIYGPGAGPGGQSSGTSGWVQDQKGVWYRFSNGTYPSNGWHYLDNHWYYFDAQGYRVTGWIWYDNHWYYSIPEGWMATGWNNVSGKWYYMGDNGIMQTGYITVDGLTYYLDSTGARLENGYTPEGHYFDNKGVMII